MPQEQMPKPSSNEDDEMEFNGAAGQERRDALKSDTDDMLDEIDDVLEEDAEEFINAYVQKGGQ